MFATEDLAIQNIVNTFNKLKVVPQLTEDELDDIFYYEDDDEDKTNEKLSNDFWRYFYFEGSTIFIHNDQVFSELDLLQIKALLDMLDTDDGDVGKFYFEYKIVKVNQSYEKRSLSLCCTYTDLAPFHLGHNDTLHNNPHSLNNLLHLSDLGTFLFRRNMLGYPVLSTL